MWIAHLLEFAAEVLVERFGRVAQEVEEVRVQTLGPVEKSFLRFCPGVNVMIIIFWPLER
jgi:hypothetical protein